MLSPMHPGSFSVRRSKDVDPLSRERFFELLAGRTLHRLSVTTGNDLHDKVRNNPGKRRMSCAFSSNLRKSF